MSFSRAKINRFNDGLQAAKQPLLTSSKTGTNKITECGSKHSPNRERSVSQPASRTNLNKYSSGGDEVKYDFYSHHLTCKTCNKRLILQRNLVGGKPQDNCSHSENSDDENFQSTTILNKDCLKPKSKDAADQVKPKEKPNNDEVVILAVGNNDNSHPKTADQNSTTRSSGSGIPLRVKHSSTPQSPRAAPILKKDCPRPSPKSVTNTPKSTPRLIAESKMFPATVRTLEMQYQSKRRRLDGLKKDLMEKQKPVLEAYEVLLQLKKKLQDSGKQVADVEDLKLVNFNGSPRQRLKLAKMTPSSDETGNSGRGEDAKTDGSKMNPEVLENIKAGVNRIPEILQDIFKDLSNNKKIMTELCNKLSAETVNEKDIRESVDVLKNEYNNLEDKLMGTLSEQEKRIMYLIERWRGLLQNEGGALTDEIEELQQKLIMKDQRIQQVELELHQTLQENHENGDQAEENLNNFREKIKMLEEHLAHDKAALQEHREKNLSSDMKMKTSKDRIKILENKNKELEVKFAELQKSHRHVQEQIRSKEHHWTKEKEDLISKHKHEKMILDKLTKEKTTFDTRARIMKEQIDEEQKKFAEYETKMSAELEVLQKEIVEVRTTKDIIENKYRSAKDQLVKMDMKNIQTIELSQIGDIYRCGEADILRTEKEIELHTELTATRIAFRAVEGELKKYREEKLKFINTMESIQGDPENNIEAMGKKMLLQVERINELEFKLGESDSIIRNQNVEITSLKAEMENLRQRLLQGYFDGSEYGSEDRLALKGALHKSYECESSVQSLKHEVDQKDKQIREMENLLKVRDGLVSMIKTKKDDVTLENESLSTYANELRHLLAQSQDEIESKTESIKDLTQTLYSKSHLCQELDKKVKELEISLSVTNEKRFKLQETVNQMEKELQFTKAHITNNLPPASRYDPGMTTRNAIFHLKDRIRESSLLSSYRSQSSCSNSCSLSEYVNGEPSSYDLTNYNSRDFKTHNMLHQLRYSEVYNKFYSDWDNLAACGDYEPFQRNEYSDVDSWKKSYESMNNIQNRLKSLKSAFESLSKTMFQRDLQLITLAKNITYDSIFDNFKKRSRLTTTTQSAPVMGAQADKIPFFTPKSPSITSLDVIDRFTRLYGPDFVNNPHIPTDDCFSESSERTADNKPFNDRSQSSSVGPCGNTNLRKTETRMIPTKDGLPKSTAPANGIAERSIFINHTNNISNHLNQRRNYNVVYPKCSARVLNNNTRHRNTACKKNKNGVTTNRNFLTRSFNQINQDLADSIDLISKNIAAKT